MDPIEPSLPSAPATPSTPGASEAAAPPPLSASRLADPSVPHDHRTYCLLMHASIVVMHFMFFLSFIVPLLMWLARKNESPFIDDHGRETVNFHLSITLYGLVAGALVFVCIGWALLPAIYVLAIVGGVMACLAASRAEYFRYPMCIRFIR